jgi:hypothetical protein
LAICAKKKKIKPVHFGNFMEPTTWLLNEIDERIAIAGCNYIQLHVAAYPSGAAHEFTPGF